MALATDLGYLPPNVKSALRNVDVLLLESNHDLEMLRDGPYPWSVKQRVLSRVGHLSNDATAEFLERDYDGGAAWIVLGHLSESNNAARAGADYGAAGDRKPHEPAWQPHSAGHAGGAAGADSSVIRLLRQR